MGVQPCAHFLMIAFDNFQKGLHCGIKILSILAQDHAAKNVDLKGVEVFDPLAFLA